MTAVDLNKSVLDGLSRMMGNYHVRFLWGKGVAKPLTYQTALPALQYF